MQALTVAANNPANKAISEAGVADESERPNFGAIHSYR